MDGFERIVQAFVAGAVAALATSVVIWLMSAGGIFMVLGIPLDASGEGVGWFLWRALRGGLWGLLLVVPFLRDFPHWGRGMIVALGPTAKLWLYNYPAEGRGLFGLAHGMGLPLTALAFWLLWGALAGVVFTLLTRSERPMDEEEQSSGRA